MKLKFKNPLAINAIAQLVEALPGEFSFGWSIRIKRPSILGWPSHFDRALNRLFVSDRPEQIVERKLPAVRWYAIPEPMKGKSVTFHGHAKVPAPNMCANGFFIHMCRSSRLFLQSEMIRAGIDCDMALIHMGEISHDKSYQKTWQANLDAAIWDYVGNAEQGGVHCPTSTQKATPITGESKFSGLEWLYGDNEPVASGVRQ